MDRSKTITPSAVCRPPAGRTYVANMVHVGAALQQQPRNVRVTTLACKNQRRAPVLPQKKKSKNSWRYQ